MKKLIPLMLGLSLALGSVALADDSTTTTATTATTKTKKTKKKPLPKSQSKPANQETR